MGGRAFGMKTVVVTGGGGFLGSALARRLRTEGYEVRSLARGHYPLLDGWGVQQVRGDLADPKVVRQACRGVDLVFHVAAKAGIWGPREHYYASNVLGTWNVIQACREEGVPRLVFTSSPSVVFDGSDLQGADESVPYASRYKAPYPETKAAAERMVLAANDESLATVALRPHLIWGPGDTHLIPGILARAGRLRRIGRRNPLVDFTYIDNAVEAHLCAARRLGTGSKCAGRAYFISQGEPIPLWDFVDRVLACAGLPPVRGTVPESFAYLAATVLEYAYRWLRVPGEPRLTRFLVEELATAHWFDIGAAVRDLGYQPPVSMEEGFRRLDRSFGETGQVQSGCSLTAGKGSECR